jgi:hypothetical protein
VSGTEIAVAPCTELYNRMSECDHLEPLRKTEVMVAVVALETIELTGLGARDQPKQLR